MIDNSKITHIAFDADDTLWVNETFFREAESEFCQLLKEYGSEEVIHQKLFDVEMQNLELYGYGVKGFMLSMVETLHQVTNGKASMDQVNQAIHIGKDMLNKPVELLDGVEEVLQSISGKYRIILATKGDLLDQERKLEKSGLENYFHHIEVMSNKKIRDYIKLMKHLDCRPEQFLMIGNSVKSDILPVVKLGAQAVHIPFHTTWAHEEVAQNTAQADYIQLNKITGVLDFL